MNVFSLYAVSFGSEGVFSQIKSQRISPGLQQMLASGDGAIDPSFAAAIRSEPICAFTTTQVATALGICGMDGIAIPTNAQNLDFWFRKRASGGIFDSGSEHVRLRIANGLLVPRPIVVRAGDPEGAAIGFEAHPISSDGAAHPISISKSQAAPVHAVETAELYTVGACYLNAVQFGTDEIQEITIDPGLDVRRLFGEGSIYPRHAAIYARNPSIRFTIYDVSTLDQATGLGMTGKTAGANTRIFLQKMEEGAALISGTAAPDEVHIKFRIREGRIQWDPVDAMHQNDATVPVVVTPTYDGTNAIIEIDTTAFISETG